MIKSSIIFLLISLDIKWGRITYSHKCISLSECYTIVISFFLIKTESLKWLQQKVFWLSKNILEENSSILSFALAGINSPGINSPLQNYTDFHMEQMSRQSSKTHQNLSQLFKNMSDFTLCQPSITLSLNYVPLSNISVSFSRMVSSFPLRLIHISTNLSLILNTRTSFSFLGKYLHLVLLFKWVCEHTHKSPYTEFLITAVLKVLKKGRWVWTAFLSPLQPSPLRQWLWALLTIPLCRHMKWGGGVAGLSWL